MGDRAPCCSRATTCGPGSSGVARRSPPGSQRPRRPWRELVGAAGVPSGRTPDDPELLDVHLLTSESRPHSGASGSNANSFPRDSGPRFRGSRLPRPSEGRPLAQPASASSRGCRSLHPASARARVSSRASVSSRALGTPPTPGEAGIFATSSSTPLLMLRSSRVNQTAGKATERKS